MTKTLSVLLLLAAPFLFWSGCEMYVITPLRGPQSLGFSLAHSGSPLFLLLLPVSAISYVLLIACSLIAFIFSCRRVSMTRFETLLAKLFVPLAVHAVLLVLYDTWSPIFSHPA